MGVGIHLIKADKEYFTTEQHDHIRQKIEKLFQSIKVEDDVATATTSANETITGVVYGIFIKYYYFIYQIDCNDKILVKEPSRPLDLSKCYKFDPVGDYGSYYVNPGNRHVYGGLVLVNALRDVKFEGQLAILGMMLDFLLGKTSVVASYIYI